MDVTTSLVLPLAWKRGPIDIALEAKGSSQVSRMDINNLRDCLMPEFILPIKLYGPHKQLDFMFIRDDLKDLLVEHMQAILQFCRNKMLSLLNRCFTKEDVKAIATKTAFQEYFVSFKKSQGWGGGVVSPYEVEEIGKVYQGASKKSCSCNQSKYGLCCHVQSMLTDKLSGGQRRHYEN
jgi:hypothetical protein